MPFQYILANLLARNDGAVGVIFLDETGEAVDVSCSEFSPYEIKVIGAYLGIYLRQVGKLVQGLECGKPSLIHIEKSRLHIYAQALPDDYYLVLVQRRPGLVGQAKVTLARAADHLRREVFD
jgi:predicted regulator of Ras-like GTPase activity (Roadblock/LC7/MglB family)